MEFKNVLFSNFERNTNLAFVQIDPSVVKNPKTCDHGSTLRITLSGRSTSTERSLKIVSIVN